MLGGHGDVERAARRADPRVDHERRQRLDERREQATQLERVEPEVEIAQQRVVGTLTLVGDALAVRSRELDVALQRRHEGGEVIVRARPGPALLARGAGLRELDGELARDTSRAREVAARDSYDVAVQLVEPLGVELVQPAAQLVARGAFVRQARERAHLLRPRRSALAGHHDELIPSSKHLHRG
jgi:hypothetical protein